jgi:hypothetical protein
MASVRQVAKSGGRSIRRTPSRARRPEYDRDCLSRLARILVNCGYSPRKLLREFRDICRGLKEPARGWDPTRLNYLTDLPHIMSYWHTDPDYLDARGKPVVLPLTGRGPSLAALVERVLPGEDPLSVADALVEFEGVRRHKGLYIPLQRHLALSKTSAHLLGLNNLLGMLRTVEHNVASRSASRIFERAAMNPSYPVSLVPLFHRWVKEYADNLLKSADNYMQAGEGKDKRGPRVRLALSVFAHETPVLSGGLPSGRKQRRASRTRYRRRKRSAPTSKRRGDR